MKIYRAENFRYRKSVYSKIMAVLTILLSAGVFFVLKYVSGNANPDLLDALGFDARSIDTLRSNMYGVRYVFASLSGVDILMMLTGIVIAIHVSSDYSQNTIRYQQGRNNRYLVYLKRLFSACTFGISILAIYMIISLVIAIIFMWKNISLSEFITALMLLIEEIVLICGFISFIYMLFTIIKNQIISVVTVILLIALVSPGLMLMCEAIGADSICDNIFIVSMLSGATVFPQSVSQSLLHILVGFIYFIISFIIGSRIYRRQKL